MKKTILFFVLAVTLAVCYGQSTFNPVRFNPVYGTVQTPDASILQRSLDRRAQQREKAAEKYAEFSEFVASLIDQLYQDEETLIWYQNLTSPMLKQIQENMDVGDYSIAITNATECKSFLKLNAELRGRISSCSEYYYARDMVVSRTDLTPEQKQNWLNTYTYLKSATIIQYTIKGRFMSR
jgi:hypothetical protein